MSILRRVIVSALAAMAVLMGGSSAFAMSTYTPGGGPDVNFVGTGVTLDVVVAGPYSNWCAQFDLAGDVISPGMGRAYGSAATALTGLTAAGCVDSLGFPSTVVGYPTWDVVVTGPASGTAWPVTVDNVNLNLTSGSGLCTFDVAGSFSGLFNTASQTLLPTSSTMEISSVPSGFLCPILGVAMGQDVDISGAFTNVPPSGSGPITIVP